MSMVSSNPDWSIEARFATRGNKRDDVTASIVAEVRALQRHQQQQQQPAPQATASSDYTATAEVPTSAKSTEDAAAPVSAKSTDASN